MPTRKSNRGTAVDMDALRSQAGENSPAVGNMRVNARGDLLGEKGEILQRAEDRVRNYYRNLSQSSTTTSLKKELSDSAPAPEAQTELEAPAPESPATTETKSAKSDKNTVQETALPPEPDEFDAPNADDNTEFEEVELPNGDIEMRPVQRGDTK